jgi:hypothetical protein
MQANTSAARERDAGASSRSDAPTLLLRDGMSFDSWTAVGRRLGRVSSASAWALGDWLLFGERMFRGRYRSAVAASDLDYQTLRNYAWVARSIPPSRRRNALSFQHHTEVAALSEPEQDLWLRRAEAGHWSRNELRRQLAGRATPAPQESAPRVVVRVEVTREDAHRWRQAAASKQQELNDWVRAVTDAAAQATLEDPDDVSSAAEVATAERRPDLDEPEPALRPVGEPRDDTGVIEDTEVLLASSVRPTTTRADRRPIVAQASEA